MIQFQLKGPSAIRQRMAELQAKLDTLAPDEPATQPGSFDGAMQGMIGSPKADGSFRPIDPTKGGFQIGRSEPSPLIREQIILAANRAGVDPNLLDALVAAESSYDPAARSHVGAIGLTQLMPGTARELGVTDPSDVVQNLNGGAKYLSQMINRFGGDLQLALAAFNAGPGAVEKFNGVPPYKETQAYVKRILDRYQGRVP